MLLANTATVPPIVSSYRASFRSTTWSTVKAPMPPATMPQLDLRTRSMMVQINIVAAATATIDS